MIVKEMKKLSARITTAAGDVSAVKGNTIAEVLAFTRENLNVNADGTIKVSKILKPNLLSEPVELPIGWINQSQYSQGANFTRESLGLVAGKSYHFSGEYYLNSDQAWHTFEQDVEAVMNDEEGAVVCEMNGYDADSYFGLRLRITDYGDHANVFINLKSSDGMGTSPKLIRVTEA